MLVLAVVWWAWNYTTWVTNELDPDSVVVRLLLIGLMFASLLMAVAIPEAFGERGMLFAASYVAIQVGRHLFLTFASTAAGTVERERVGAGPDLARRRRASSGSPAAPPTDSTRVVLWLIALAIDYGAPAVVYWVPGRPQLTNETWDVETVALRGALPALHHHRARRVDRDHRARRPPTSSSTRRATAALGLAFLATAAMWWLYFNYVAAIAQRRLEVAPNRTLLARDGYTYLHVVLVAGIIVGAVGDELVIAHPTDVLPTAEVVVIAAGPAIYLLGHSLFRLVMAGSLSGKRLAGAVACVPVGLIGLVVPALVLAALLVGVFVTVIVTSASRRCAGSPAASRRRGAARRSRRAGGGRLAPLPERLESAARRSAPLDPRRSPQGDRAPLRNANEKGVTCLSQLCDES